MTWFIVLVSSDKTYTRQKVLPQKNTGAIEVLRPTKDS